MLIELKDIHDEVFSVNPDLIAITYRKPDTDIYVLRTLVEDREIDAGTMVYLHSIPTLSLSIIKLDEKELEKCKGQVSSMFPQLNPHILIVEPRSRNFYPKDTVQLRAIIKDSKETNIIWSTSDPEVATVDNGLVTFIKAGSVAITASNPNIPAPGVVIMSVNPVTLSLAPNNVELLQDSAKFQLMAIAIPNDKITWTSKNTSVATVDINGLVTPVGPGTVEIEASVRGVKAISRITVKTPSITLNVPDTNTLMIDKTLHITASVENLNNKNVTWSSSNLTVATVENGSVVAKSSGSVVIKAAVGNVEKSVTINVPQVVITAPTTLAAEVDSSVNWEVSCTGTDVKPTLSSLNTNIATVTQAGEVTALEVGEVTLRASVHGIQKDCLLTVTSIPEQPAE